FIEKARHIEVQVIGDGKGDAVHLYERDCSIQRNNQKLLEEAPAAILSDEERKYITETTRDAMKQLKYRGDGTVEYLYVEKVKKFNYFEMKPHIKMNITIIDDENVNTI